MEHSKRIFTFLTFIICCLCLTLLVASLATQSWLTAKPVRFNLLNSTGQNLKNANDPNKFRGEIHFGLFQCTKILNYGFGDRITNMWIKDELIKNPTFLPFGLWLFTILSVAIAILFGIIASLFSIINTVMNPIENIVGIQGLFVWNGLGALFCTSACISFLIQYRNKLRKNVLTQDEVNDGWSSKNLAWLGYSYFLVVIALGLFLFNILLIFIITRRPFSRRKVRTIQNKNPEGVIMLY